MGDLSPLQIAVTVAITWLFARLYYRKQSEDLRQEHDRVLDRISQLLRIEDARDLSLEDLEEVVLERGYPTEFGIVPAECPECGADTDTKGGVQTGPTGDRYPWMTVFCLDPDCEWSQGM